MSLTKAVAPSYSPQYDIMDDDGGRTPNNYDPAFTADIALKMNIPHRIGAFGRPNEYDFRGNSGFGPHDPRQEGIASMDVPDKIILLGQNESLGLKEELNLHLDYPSSDPTSSYVNVSTPPRVLTLEELPFPTLDDGYGRQREAKQGRMNGKVVDEYRALRDGLRYSLDASAIQNSSEFPDSSLAYIGNGVESETVIIQRHLSRLSRHIMRLESSNASRMKREMILYPVVFGYIFVRITRWLLGFK